MSRIVLLAALWLVAVVFCSGCSNPSMEPATNGSPDPPAEPVTSSLLDPAGDFTLYVSNQSFAITPVDIRVEIDGEEVIHEDFEVGNHHNWKSFKLKLALGTHDLKVSSRKGDAELTQTFEGAGPHWAVIDYWYYPETHASPTPKQFSFNIQDEPILFQ